MATADERFNGMRVIVAETLPILLLVAIVLVLFLSNGGSIRGRLASRRPGAVRR
jgi:hypothetical protein